MKPNYVLIGLLALTVVVAAFLFSDPEAARRYAEMQRDAVLPESVKEVVIALLALVIGGYVAWHYTKRD